MERELVELFEAAKKAANAAAAEDGGATEESRCLDVLKQLRDFPVNYQVLVSTQEDKQLFVSTLANVTTNYSSRDDGKKTSSPGQVGKRLRHLTKHPRKKIQSSAAALIEIWKSIIIEETTQKKNGNSDSNNSVKVEHVNSDSTKKAIPVKVEKVSRGENVKAETIEQGVSPRQQKSAKTETGSAERRFENGNTLKIESSSSAERVKAERIIKQDKLGSSMTNRAPNAPPKFTSMIKCNDAMRDKVRDLLLEALSKVSTEADDSIKPKVDTCDSIRVAISVESVMFEKWGSSNGAHKFKYRSIMFNMKDPNNPDFRRKVLVGEIEPERIVNLTATEMASEQRKIENQQIEEKKLFDCERSGAPKATTDEFKCVRCGQRECTYYQLQTRSADEPMTTFVTCVNCNNHWKFC